MKSPFPGMDPYLEKHWRDVHAGLIIYSRDQIQDQLPGGLRCRVEERVVLEMPEGPGRSMYPDLRVLEKRPENGPSPSRGSSVVVTEPLIVHVPDETFTETFLEIIDAATGNKVITVIEFLSLSNKIPGEGQTQYNQKKTDLFQAAVSLVEIDLLRQGQRFYPVELFKLPPSHRTHSQIVVRRGWRPDLREVYGATLREPLPTIKIPLRPEDADVLLELQFLIEKCYRNGRYEDLDYSVAPVPPLEGSDIPWVDELLRQAGKRN